MIGAVGAALVTLGVAVRAASFVLGGLASILAGVKVAFAAMTVALGVRVLSPVFASVYGGRCSRLRAERTALAPPHRPSQRPATPSGPRTL